MLFSMTLKLGSGCAAEQRRSRLHVLAPRQDQDIVLAVERDREPVGAIGAQPEVLDGAIMLRHCLIEGHSAGLFAEIGILEVNLEQLSLTVVMESRRTVGIGAFRQHRRPRFDPKRLRQNSEELLTGLAGELDAATQLCYVQNLSEFFQREETHGKKIESRSRNWEENSLPESCDPFAASQLCPASSLSYKRSTYLNVWSPGKFFALPAREYRAFVDAG